MVAERKLRKLGPNSTPQERALMRKAWADVLESGQYTRGEEALVSRGEHCCLGVLANELGDLDENGSGTSCDGSRSLGSYYDGHGERYEEVALGFAVTKLMTLNDGGAEPEGAWKIIPWALRNLSEEQFNQAESIALLWVHAQ